MSANHDARADVR